MEWPPAYAHPAAANKVTQFFAGIRVTRRLVLSDARTMRQLEFVMRGSLHLISVVLSAGVLSASGGLLDQGPGPGAGDDVVFFSARAGNNEIYRMTGDPRFPLRITNHPLSDVDPAISPNG